MTGLDRLPNLIRLNLATNSISDLSPLERCKKLLTLTLSSNPVTDISSLPRLRRLVTLHLTRNQISSIEPLAEMLTLKRLRLNYNQVKDISPLLRNAEAGGLGKGTVIWLHYNPLPKDSYPSDLAKLRKYGVTVHYEFGPGIDPHTGRGPKQEVPPGEEHKWKVIAREEDEITEDPPEELGGPSENWTSLDDGTELSKLTSPITAKREVATEDPAKASPAPKSNLLFYAGLLCLMAGVAAVVLLNRRKHRPPA